MTGIWGAGNLQSKGCHGEQCLMWTLSLQKIQSPHFVISQIIYLTVASCSVSATSWSSLFTIAQGRTYLAGNQSVQMVKKILNTNLLRITGILLRILTRPMQILKNQPDQVIGSPKEGEVSTGRQQLSLCRAHSDRPSLWLQFKYSHFTQNFHQNQWNTQ